MTKKDFQIFRFYWQQVKIKEKRLREKVLN